MSAAADESTPKGEEPPIWDAGWSSAAGASRGRASYRSRPSCCPIPRPRLPVTRVLLHDCWLGLAGTVVRGYQSGRWRLNPSIEPFECPACFGALSAEGDLFYHHHAVGSLLHLHLGALPEVVDGVRRASLPVATASVTSRRVELELTLEPPGKQRRHCGDDLDQDPAGLATIGVGSPHSILLFQLVDALPERAIVRPQFQGAAKRF